MYSFLLSKSYLGHKCIFSINLLPITNETQPGLTLSELETLRNRVRQLEDEKESKLSRTLQEIETRLLSLEGKGKGVVKNQIDETRDAASTLEVGLLLHRKH